MTSRRRFIEIGALGAIAPACVFAQARRVKVGMLSPRRLNDSAYAPGVVKTLGELGYRDGTTMILEYRSADGSLERYPALARELTGLQCDVIFAFGTAPAEALRDLGYPIPVVFLAIDADPLERKIVSGLSKPGVNATGVYFPQDALNGKRLEIMREVMPGMRRLLVFADGATRSQVPAVRRSAERVGVQPTIVEFSKQPYNYEGAFTAGRKAQVEALLTLSSPVLSTERRAIVRLLGEYRLPSIGSSLQMAEAGFLLALNVDPVKATRRAAEIGVRVLKGTRPADLPVEQVDEFELMLNSKTARALGVRIPESVLARATRIVQ